jgi:hypothetical protein
MANPEHLAILKQGVEQWNKWRSDRPDVLPDLTRADVRKWICAGRALLSEASLPGANLRGADQTSDEKPPMAGKSPPRRGGVTLTESTSSPFHAEPREVELLCPWANPSGEVSACCWYVASCTAPQQPRTPHLQPRLKQHKPTCNNLQGASVLCAHFRPLIM